MAALCAIWTPGFMVDDDVVMSAFASGTYAGRPTSHLVFMNVVLGWALAALYRLIPPVPWYVLMLWAAQAVAWGVVLWAGVLARRTRSLAPGFLAIAVVVLGMPRLGLQPTFTSTAILVGTAGVVLAAQSIDRLPHQARVLAIAGGVMLGVASFFRSDALTAVAVAFFPVLVALGWRAGWRSSVAFVAAAFVVAGTGALLQRQSFESSSAWREYGAYNSARGELHGTARLKLTPQLSPVLRRINWTADDLVLFRRFVYADPHVFNRQAVEALRDATSSQHSKESIHNAYTTLFKPYAEAIAALAGLIALAFLRLRARIASAMLLAVGWFIAVLAGLSVYARLPTHVGWPLWISAIVLAAVLADVFDRTSDPRRDRVTRDVTQIAALILVALGIVAISDAGRLSSANQELREKLRNQLATLHAIDAHGTFVARGSIITFEGTDPLRVRDPYAQVPNLVQLGWPTFSPPFNERIRRLGTGDILTKFVSDPFHTYFVGEPTYAGALRRSLAYHDGIKISFVRVGSEGLAADVWRPQRQPHR